MTSGGSLTIEFGASIEATSFNSGNAGAVLVTAVDQIQLHEGGFIRSSTAGSGRGEKVTVATGFCCHCRARAPGLSAIREALVLADRSRLMPTRS